MAFVFSKSISDIVRDRKWQQQIKDGIKNKQRGKNAPQELPNLAMHGMTSNGTYFFCNLAYKKDLLERKKMTLFTLIDEYAKTQDRAKKIQLKAQITEACGEQVEGISLLFSGTEGIYGFVTGQRLKVARLQDEALLALDADEMFAYLPDTSGLRLRLGPNYLVFILENESTIISERIKQFIKSNETDDEIDTEVINAIKYINRPEKPDEDINLYLKSVYSSIKDPALKSQALSIYNAIELLDHDKHLKYEMTALTLQLLHSKNAEEQQQLLSRYTQLTSTLYGSKQPTLIIIGVSAVLLGITLLVLALTLTPPLIPFYLMLVGSAMSILGGLICTLEGRKDFYNKEAKQRRSTAKTFFNLKESVDNLSGNPEIPQKISEIIAESSDAKTSHNPNP